MTETTKVQYFTHTLTHDTQSDLLSHVQQKQY